MKITIDNFDKFNPRKELKSMPWLRLQNDFYDKEDFFGESVNTHWLFIFLLCQCAQKLSKTIDLPDEYLFSKSKLKKADFLNSLEKLEQKHMVSYSRSDVVRTRKNTCYTNKTNGQNEQVASDKEIELIYQSYPRKVGKKKGLLKLRDIIKTKTIYDEILQGSKNYNLYVERNDIIDKYTKNFTTWVNGEHWSDTLDIPPTPEELQDVINKM